MFAKKNSRFRTQKQVLVEQQNGVSRSYFKKKNAQVTKRDSAGKTDIACPANFRSGPRKWRAASTHDAISVANPFFGARKTLSCDPAPGHPSEPGAGAGSRQQIQKILGKQSRRRKSQPLVADAGKRRFKSPRMRRVSFFQNEPSQNAPSRLFQCGFGLIGRQGFFLR